MSTSAPLVVLSRSLDQLGDLLVHVREDQLDRPTPCSGWSLGDLADHVVAGPSRFAAAMRGEQVDWSAAPDHVTGGWAARFRAAADDLMHLWHSAESAGGGDPDWQTAELAVHAWDLAHALGRPTSELDAEVAARGHAFMSEHLHPDARGDAFLPEQQPPAGGDAYDALAAFAGRTA